MQSCGNVLLSFFYSLRVESTSESTPAKYAGLFHLHLCLPESLPVGPTVLGLFSQAASLLLCCFARKRKLLKFHQTAPNGTMSRECNP